MSGPQFIHVETYATSVSKLRRKREVARAEEGKPMDRKLTLEEICNEAGRIDGHHDHVREARPPVHLLGVRPEEVPAMHAKRIIDANTAIKNKKAGMARGTRKDGPRAIRPDTHTALTMVASYPKPWVDQETDTKLLDNQDDVKLLHKWQVLNIAWAKLKAAALGFELVSVVRHDDEGYPHLHFIGLPTNERMEARACHPGYIAKEGVARIDGEDDKSLTRRKNAAYSNAMRAFQDDYYKNVGMDAGLLRLGPKRRRLPNAVYKSEKTAAAAVGLANVRADELAQRNKDESEKLDETKAIAEGVGQEAVEALVLKADLNFELHQVEDALKNKRAEASALEMVLNGPDSVRAELEQERALLEAVKKQRERHEEEVAKLRAQIEREQAQLVRDRESLDGDKREHKEEAKKKEQGLLLQQESLAASQAEVDALVEGIEAFADGRLKHRPSTPDTPLAFVGKVDPELLEKLRTVKPKLVRIIARLDQAMAARMDRLRDALTSALAAWSNGLLDGLGDPLSDGRPTFIVPETEDGDRLIDKINPFREVVAQVISVLPDLAIVKAVKHTLDRLRPHLSVAGTEEARILERDTAYLQQQVATKRNE